MLPTSTSVIQPSSKPSNISTDNDSNSVTTSPFRNIAKETVSTILVNTKLTLPPPSDGIKESIAVFPVNGVIQVNPGDGGSITYTPNINFVGSDTFTIQQCLPSNNETTSDAAECKTFMVVVEVTKASSPSNGIYGLFALILLPLLLIGYWMCRCRKGEDTDTAGGEQNGNSNKVAVPSVSNTVSAPVSSVTSSNISNSAAIQVPSHLVSELPTGADYQVTQKDQCRSVVGVPIRIVNAVAIPNKYQPHNVDVVPVDPTATAATDTVSGSPIWEA
jgi:hypothetical protein